MIIELVAHGRKKLIYLSKYGVMTKDENGTLHPETAEEEVQLRERRERFEKNWNRKARREGWERKPADQQKKNLKPVDRFFAEKKKREGWGSQNTNT